MRILSSLHNFTINDNCILHITRRHNGTSHEMPVAHIIRVRNKLARNITADGTIRHLRPMKMS